MKSLLYVLLPAAAVLSLPAFSIAQGPGRSIPASQTTAASNNAVRAVPVTNLPASVDGFVSLDGKIYVVQFGLASPLTQAIEISGPHGRLMVTRNGIIGARGETVRLAEGAMLGTDGQLAAPPEGLRYTSRVINIDAVAGIPDGDVSGVINRVAAPGSNQGYAAAGATVGGTTAR